MLDKPKIKQTILCLRIKFQIKLVIKQDIQINLRDLYLFVES